MNPLGKHFGLMTAGDLICLDIKTGKIVGGNRVCLLASLRRFSTKMMRALRCACLLLDDVLT